MNAGETKTAIADFSFAIENTELVPKNEHPRWWVRDRLKYFWSRAEGYEKDGDFTEALKDYEFVVRTYNEVASRTDSCPYDIRAGNVLWKLKRKEEAIKRYSSVISDCKDGRAFTARGKAYLESSDFRKALADFEAAAQMHESESAEVYYLLGYCYEMLSDKGNAADNYRKALEKNPGYSEARARARKLGFDF
jgi:tetratricopeptide (TPR) repeat protein